MKIQKNEVAGALVALGKLVCRTSPVEVYRGIQLESQGDKLRFRTQNGDETLDYLVDAEFSAPFAVIVNFDDFRNAIRSCRNKDVVLELADEHLIVDHVQIPIIHDTGRVVNAPDDAKPTLLPTSFVKMLENPVSVIDRNDYRRILRGVHLCKDGFVATNGKVMIHIAAQLEIEDLTIPFPAALLATKSAEAGTIKAWKEEATTCFQIATGSWMWTAKAVDGVYPNWQLVVPTEGSLEHSAQLDAIHAMQLIAFLKAVPADLPNNPICISQSADQKSLVLESDNAMHTQLPAVFEGAWNGVKLSVNKDILLLALQQGHTKIAFSDEHKPFMATGGFGQYVAMPLFDHKTTQAQNQPKEEPKMSEVKTSVVTAPVQPVVTNNEPEVPVNPLDELSAAIDDFKARIRTMFDESSALSRKVKEVALAQKQKERDFLQAKRAIERIRMAI